MLVGGRESTTMTWIPDAIDWWHPAATTPAPSAGRQDLRRQHSGEIVEGRLPTLTMRSPRLFVRESTVGQHYGRAPVVERCEVHLDELGALVTRVSIPSPGEDETFWPGDFDVRTTAAQLLPVGPAHYQPEAAAHAHVNLGDRRVPVGAGRPPTSQYLGARPGVEDGLRWGIEGPLQPEHIRVRAHRQGHLPFAFCSSRYSSTTSNMRVQMARWRSNQSTASPSASRSSPSRWVRPSIVRTTTPASSSTLTCLEIVGFETPNPLVAAPIVAGPAPSRSTIPRRIGWARALNGSLAIACPLRRLDPRLRGSRDRRSVRPQAGTTERLDVHRFGTGHPRFPTVVASRQVSLPNSPAGRTRSCPAARN